MPPFDPDAYLNAAPKPQGFDPDAYLAGGASPSAELFERTGGTAPDKYQQAAIAERDKMLKSGVPMGEGYTRRLMSGPLLGWADEIVAAGMTPFEMARQGTINPAEGYRYARARERLASEATSENTGLTGSVVEGVGALATLPGQIFARPLAAALGGGGRGVLPAAGRMAGYGAESGVLGAVQGAGNAETVADIPREAVRGGAVSAALGAPFGAFANVARQSTAAVPTQAELFALGARDARAIDKSPVRYDLGHVAQRMDDIRQANRNKYGRDTPLTNKAIADRVAEAHADIAAANALNPNAAGAILPRGQVSGAPNPWQATATPRDIRSLRGEIYEAGAKGKPVDERAATISAKILDRVTTRPNPASLAAGSPRDAAAVAMLEARRRGNFAPAYRDKAVRAVVDDATATASGQHSGLNFENIIRQKLRTARGADDFGALNQAEEAILDKMIAGSTKANARRELGNMLGGGGGLGRMIALGGGAGGGALTSYLTGGDPWAGAALGVGAGMTGRVLRNQGNRQARQAVDAFSEQIRKRSPEYRRRLATAPTAIGPGLSSSMSGARQALTLGGGGGVRDAISRALLLQMSSDDENRK